MDHDHALRIAAVERFLLNELPQDERDQFEEHFFDCQECALDLRAGAAFLGQAKKQLAAARALTQPAEPLARKKRLPAALNFLWRPMLVVPALAILLLAVGYQDTVTLPRLERKAAGQDMPQILPTVSLDGAGNRGGQIPSVNAGGHPFLLLFDIPAPRAARFSQYTCSLYSPSGTLLFRTRVSAEQARNTISLRVPRLNPGDGVYSLAITGDSLMQNQVDVARYPFLLKQQS